MIPQEAAIQQSVTARLPNGTHGLSHSGQGGGVCVPRLGGETGSCALTPWYVPRKPKFRRHCRRSLMIITDASAEEVHVLSQIHWIILIVTHVEVTLIGVVSNLREPLVVGH